MTADPGHARRRLAVVLAGIAAFVSLYSPQSLMPVIHGWLGDSALLAGMVVSGGTLGVALSAPFAGAVADRLGRRRTIVWCAFLVVVPALCVGLAQTPAQMIAARVVQGLFLPGVFAVAVAYIGSEWPATQARAVTALYVAGTIGGGFGGRLLSGAVTEFAGWRWALVSLAVLQLLLALLIRRWLPEEREKPARHGPAFAQFLDAAGRPELRGVYAVGFSLLFALVAGFTYVTLRLSEPPFSLGPASLSLLFSVYLLSIVLTPLSGGLLNRLGHAKVLTLAWGIAIAGLAVSLVPDLLWITVGLAVFSVGIFMAQTTATSFVAEASGTARTTAVGLYVFCYYVGGTVGGVLPAPLWNLAGWPLVAALIALMGAGSAYIGRRSFRLAKPAAGTPAPMPEVGGEAP